MDDIDKKILSLLQVNADIPVAELSKKVNLSSTPCWLRINKLYKQGYIKKKVAVIDRSKINLSTVAFVQIRTSQHNMTWSKKFIEGVKEMDEVVEFYRLSGTTDYLLKVLVPSIETGNGLVKMMIYFMGACAAGVVIGGKVPVVITSRSDEAPARLASIAAAVVALD